MHDYLEYAQSFIGTKYVWGGNTPEQGFDCSGFVCEVLKSYGLINNKDDFSASKLRLLKVKGDIDDSIPLAFYGTMVTGVTHVAIVFDQHFVIEAAGEGRASTDKGFVRIRPIDYRSDLLEIL